jgi:alginate O-acetyltransferase complex protein AlgI
VLFVGPAFFAALVVLVALYYAPPLRRWQPELLIVASLGWYLAGQGRGMALLLVGSAGINAFVSWRVSRAGDGAARRRWAVAGVAVNLVLLGAFKYLPWIGRILTDAQLSHSPAMFSPYELLMLIPLPIGISFYTFHGISLLVDVWRGTYAPTSRAATHARDTLLYLVFFPQLVAGPIVRARRFLPQIGPRRWDQIRWRPVASAMIAGYFFKLVVADHLNAVTIGLDAPDFSGIPAANLLALVVAFAAQLFADFAAYSFIALGLARLFGYLLPPNFAHPYTARSLRDFWRRWHRSLSAWLRDYLYVPLGGNHGARTIVAARLIAVFVIGGLWHGVAWGLVLWGLWHGCWVVAERITGRSNLLLTQGVVLIGWLLFRIPDLGRLRSFAQAFADGVAQAPSVLPIAMALLFAFPVVLHHAWPRLMRGASVRWVPWAEGAMLAAIVLDAATPTPFVYFQF